MNAAISADKTQAKSGDSVLYTVTVNSDTPMDSAVIEILPSVEAYPQTNIIPDASTLTASDSIPVNGKTESNGIFTVTVPDAAKSTSVSFSYSADIGRLSEKSTTAAMITVNHSGGSSETYCQTVIAPMHGISILPAALSLTAIAAAAYLFYRIFLHSR